MKRIILAVCGLLLQVWAQPWFPSMHSFPTGTFGSGLWGNPATMDMVDGWAWNIIYNREVNSFNHESFSMGIKNGGLGLAYQHLPEQDLNLYSITVSSSLGQRLYFGFRPQFWRETRNGEQSWTLTPGLLIIPHSMLRLAWSAPNLFHTGDLSTPSVHQLGMSLHLGDVLSLHTYLEGKDLDGALFTEGDFYGGAVLNFNAFGISIMTPLRNRTEEAVSFALSIPLGRRQELTGRTGTNELRSLAISGHSAPRLLSVRGREIVRFDLSTPIEETKQEWMWFESDKLTLPLIEQQFEYFKREGTIAGVLFDLSGYQGNLATSMELRRLIQALNKAGKKTYAYLDAVKLPQLLVASACQKTAVHPNALVHVRGLGTQVTHYKGLLDWAGIKLEVVKHGTHKSAMEPFTLDSMSAEARHDLQNLLQGMWQSLADSITQGRSIKVDQFNAFADSASLLVQDAVQAQLVDTALQYDDLDEWLNVPQIGTWQIQEYRPYAEQSQIRKPVAILHLDGNIIEGQGGSQGPFGKRSIGYPMVRDFLDRIKHLPLQALILRINSPGGSAQASDQIWSAIEAFKKESDIPVVASVGSMAASGGYYIAAAADQIVAEPTSIVGSIGVFGGKLNLQDMMAKIHLKSFTVKTHEHGDAQSIQRGLTEKEEKILQESMDAFYQQFTGVVQQSRGERLQAPIDSLAQGRVFSGEKARQVGLIDAVGGLRKAIQTALPQYAMDELDLLHFGYDSDWSLEILKPQAQALSPFTDLYQVLEKYQTPQIWAYWPYAISLQ